MSKFFKSGAKGFSSGLGSSLLYSYAASGPTPATTTIADVTNTSGNVTTLSTGTISLEEGVPYFFQSAWYNGSGSNGDAKLYINADTTAANYESGYVTESSGLVAVDESDAHGFTADNGATCVIDGLCGLQNSIPYFVAKSVHISADKRAQQVAQYNINESTFTELQLTSVTASGVANNSYIKIWKLNQTPLVDVSVSGASVTTLATGVFSLEVDRTYLMISNINAENSSSYCEYYINNDTNSNNYNKGFLNSGATPNGDVKGATKITSVSNGMGINYATIGIASGIPYIDSLILDKNTSARSQMQIVQNISESTFTSIYLTSNAANWLKDGTFIKIYELGA